MIEATRFLGLCVVAWLLVPMWAMAEDLRIPVAGGAEQLKTQLEPLGWRVESHADGSIDLWPPGGSTSDEASTEGAPGGNTVGFTDLARLQDMLRRTGWEARREADGSLTLQLLNKAEEGGVSEEEGGVSEEEGGVSEDEGKNQLRDLYVLLKASGWSAVESSDGSLLLQPGAAPFRPVETIQVPSDDLEGLKEALVSSGWHIERPPQGGLVAVRAAASTASAPVAQSPANEDDGSQGSAQTEVDLKATPVGSDKAVVARVTEWLNAQGRTDVQVGRVRKVVNWVYVVSLVDREAPYTLRNQVVVRARDGEVIPLM